MTVQLSLFFHQAPFSQQEIVDQVDSISGNQEMVDRIPIVGRLTS
jgi:hypothetical protein